MLGGIIALYLATGAHSVRHARRSAVLATRLPAGVQTAIFIAIAVGLAVKVPIFPLHTWLPDAHVEAPTAVSVLLAGVLLKMGALRLPAAGSAAAARGLQGAAAPCIAVLAVISIVYGAALALVQTDLKKLVAYSSVSHMGYVMLGIAAGTAAGVTGAQVQMFSHGLIAALLFLLVGTPSTSARTRVRSRRSAASPRSRRSWPARWSSRRSPRSACPGMSGFVGEFMVIVGLVPGVHGATR